MALFKNKKTEMVWEVTDEERIHDLRKDVDYEEIVQVVIEELQTVTEDPSIKKSSKKA